MSSILIRVIEASSSDSELGKFNLEMLYKNSNKININYKESIMKKYDSKEEVQKPEQESELTDLNS